MKKRRFLSLLICAAMLCSLVGAPALADEGTPAPAASTEETTTVGNLETPPEGTPQESTPVDEDELEDPNGATGKTEETIEPGDTQEPVEDAADEGEELDEQEAAPDLEAGDPSVAEDGDNPTGEPGDPDGGATGDDVDGGEADEEGSNDGEGPTGGEGSEDVGGENGGEETPGTGEPNPDDEQTVVGEDGEQTEVGDEETAEAMALSLENELMPVAETVPSGFSIKISGPKAGDYYCPGASATVSSNAELKSATVNGSEQSASGNSFTVSSMQADTTIGVTDVNGKSASYSITVKHLVYTATVVETEPTCTEDGYKKSYYTCRICGQILNDAFGTTVTKTKDALGHDFQEEKVVNASECGGDSSVTVKVCARCGIVETTGGSLGTDHSYETVEKPATCQTEGYTYRQCSKCGAIEEESYQSTPAGPFGHQWTAWETVTEQTCTTPYVTQRECGICQQREQKTLLQRLGHSVTGKSWKVTKEPTCEAEGEKKQKCDRCDYVPDDAVTESIPKTDHNWVEDVDQRKEPTCTDAGEKHFTCSACASTKTETIEATEHTPSPTEYEVGEKQHWHKCAVCGEAYGDPEEHALTRSDCTQPLKCAVCGYEEPNSASTHSFSSISTSGHYGSCSVCHKVLSYGAHQYRETESCTDERHCMICGYKPAQFTEHRPMPAKWTDSGDGATHYRRCSNTPSCTYRFTQPHVLPANRDCTQGIYCTLCGAEIAPPTSGHVWSKSEHQDDQIGIVYCTNPHCTQTEERNHKIKTSEEIEEAATCTTPGKKIVHKWCEGCNFAFEDEEVVIPATGHSFNDWHHVDTPTCNASGIQQRECQNPNCSHVETQVLDATGHELGDWEDQTPATCTTDGVAVRKCKNCHAIQDTKDIPKLGHSYEDTGEVIPAKCESDSYKVQTCSRCKDSTIHVEVPNTHLGHDFDDYTYQSNATCTEDGTEIGKCTRCGVIGGERTVAGTAAGHVYAMDNDCTTVEKCALCGEPSETYPSHAAPADAPWEIDPVKGTHYKLCANPHCEQIAVEAAHTPAADDGDCTTPILCTVCGTVVSPGNKAHDFLQWTEDGDAHGSVCSVDGCEQTAREPHDFKDYIYQNDATCTEDGTETGKCAKCGAEDVRSVSGSALGHVPAEGTTVVTPPTCTEPGAAERRCERCGEAVESGIAIPATGHNFPEAWSHDEQTHHRTCQNEGCMARESDPHAAGQVITRVDVEPDCDDPGLAVTLTFCSVCGRELSCVETAMEPTGHTFGEWQQLVTPDCDDAGSRQRVCEVCGFIETEVQNANGHDWEAEYTVDQAATCQEAGSESIHCKNCEATKDARTIPAIPHEYVIISVLQERNCTDNEVDEVACKLCGILALQTQEGTALGHDFTGYAPLNDETCTEDGHEKGYCTRCDEVDVRVLPGTALGHTAASGEGTVVKAPTCTQPGRTEYTCERCGELFTRDDLPATGHKAIGEGDKAATCTEAGYKGATLCSVCGETLNARTAIPALGHSFGAWSAAGSGNHASSCGRCGATKSEACSYSEIKVGAVTMHVCKVCGDVVDPTGGEAASAGRFEVVAEATSEEVDPGAIPSGCELIVRKLDVPFQEEQEVLEAFTLGCEQDGVALPLLGRIRVTMPVGCPMPFRLIRVDAIEDAQTGETTEQRVEIEFAYENGHITFETDRDGMFLLTQLDEEI